MHCILYCVCIYICNEFTSVFLRITEQGWSTFHRRQNHVSKSWMQGFTITDGGFYSVLLNPATKVDPDTAEVKADKWLLNFWLFCSCTVNILRWDENLSGTKTWWCHAGKIQSKRKVCRWKMITEGTHYSSPENYYFFFSFFGKTKEKSQHSKNNTNNDVSEVFISHSC